MYSGVYCAVPKPHTGFVYDDDDDDDDWHINNVNTVMK